MCSGRVCAPRRCRPAPTCGINSSARAGALQPRARGCVRCHRPGSRALAAGVTFTNRTLKAGWAGRWQHASVVDAAGAIYVIGGGTDGYTFYADVWASTDGGARGGRGVLGGHSMGLLWGTTRVRGTKWQLMSTQEYSKGKAWVSEGY